MSIRSINVCTVQGLFVSLWPNKYDMILPQFIVRRKQKVLVPRVADGETI